MRLKAAPFLLLVLSTAKVAAEKPQLVPLTWETVDYEFTATLGIGTPAQPFRLVIDTGSANLWVPSSTCSSTACTQRAQYNPQQSSTSKVLGQQVAISYGAGQVNSILVKDVVSLPASSSSSSGFVPGVGFTQTLGMALQMDVGNSSSSMQQPWDGILGMGRAKLAAGGVEPPVLSMYKQGVISQPRFGLYLLQESSGPESGGEMALGGYNDQRVAGDITWVDVVMPTLAVQQGFWSVPIDSVGLAWPNGSSSTPSGACAGFAGSSSSSGSSGSSGQPGCIGILDSGTSAIIGSIDQVAALNAALGGVPSIQQVPFDCGKAVAAVLGETAQALSTDDPETAANQVCSSMFGANAADSLGSVLCGAVQQELFLAQQQAPSNSPAQAMAAAQDRSLSLCEQLPYAFNVTLDCSSISSMPAMQFNIGGKTFAVPVGDYAYQNNRQCFSKITAMGALGPGAWLLGSSFMHNMYTVFDYAAAQKPAGGVRGLKQVAVASAGPRVGFGELNAAEKAAAQAAFDMGLASRSGGGSRLGSSLTGWQPLLALLGSALLVTGF